MCFARAVREKKREREGSILPPTAISDQRQETQNPPGLRNTGGADVGIEGAESVVKEKHRPTSSGMNTEEKRFPRGLYRLSLAEAGPPVVGARMRERNAQTSRASPSSRCKLFALFPVQPEVREMARR